MSAIDFLIGIHNHQPVGNFGHVFEESYETCYLPQLEMLKKHPEVKMSLHHSGPLLEWIESNRPKYIDMVASMAEQGQIEIMSGGFYEPILSSIPEDDAIGQVMMMNEYAVKRFGQAPKGMWTAERIWDPSLPKIIAAAGLEFTLLDDTHFYYAGLKAEDMFGYYMTEKHGARSAVFPIDKNLRYSIPFKMPHETIDYFRWLRDEKHVPCVTYGDDGEKFGVWPETYHWVFEEKWLDNFYTALEENQDVVKTGFFSEHIERNASQGRIYLPMASYEEMSEWSLSAGAAADHERAIEKINEIGMADEWKPFVRGGIWDNFIAKYEEANRMHKKMLHVSAKLAKAEKKHHGPKIEEARRDLYMGQCNCSYWHGLFGGLYLNYLRHAVYEHLIRAENKITEATRRAKEWVEIETLDFDADGSDEIVFETPELAGVIDPGYGGCVALLDYRPANFSLSNTFTRVREAYHGKVHATSEEGQDGSQPASIHDIARSKEPDLHKALVYDDHTRYSFQERFFGHDVDIENFARSQSEELGDFITGEYKAATESDGKLASITLSRHGNVKHGQTDQELHVEKTFTISSGGASIKADYKITNTSPAAIDMKMGVEFNLTLLAADAADRYWTGGAAKGKPRLKETLEDAAAKKIGMRDDWFGFEVNLSSPQRPDWWRFPVETVSQSESGFERTYQGSCIMAIRDLKLDPGEPQIFSITLDVKSTK